MDIESVRELIFDTVSETLEVQAFMEVSLPEEGDEVQPGEGVFLWGRIEIKNPGPASLSLVLPLEMVQEITQTLFGSDPEEVPAPSMVQDTLAELVNTVAGRLMSELVAPDESLEIGLPTTGTGTVDTNQAEVFHYLANEYLFSVVLKGAI